MTGKLFQPACVSRPQNVRDTPAWLRNVEPSLRTRCQAKGIPPRCAIAADRTRVRFVPLPACFSRRNGRPVSSLPQRRVLGVS